MGVWSTCGVEQCSDLFDDNVQHASPSNSSLVILVTVKTLRHARIFR